MTTSSLLELAHQKLYWPSPEQIWEPSGAGAGVYARLADEKIGNKIRRELPDARGAKVSVLAANPFGDATESPIAVVCEFPRPISETTLKEIYRLAWSFSRTRALITVEPQLLRVWSCCEPPEESKQPRPVTEINDLSGQAAQALQWVELVSGEFFEKNNKRFQRQGAADQKLLENLREVRRQLLEDGLDPKIIHDLLARIIFAQYLFHRKDSQGNPALSESIMSSLAETGVLSRYYNDLPDILENFEDTYQFFQWLNGKFNGDLFPGTGKSPEEQEREWRAEMNEVKKKPYLRKLADFVRGDLELKSGQHCLWPMYSFEVIPLEFISSIYEEFVKKYQEEKQAKNLKNKKKKKNQEDLNNKKQADKTVHYTPEFIVDFVLDGVLPWNDDDERWDLKILDPACGSGIFLVKAYQRIIYRWEKAHARKIYPDILKSILENNFFGVDIDSEAIRVASFSFYLMMLDHIEPLDYWENEVRFPNLRGKRLIVADFFEEDKDGFRTKQDAGTYDLVLGNAPWGKDTLTEKANLWIENYGWKDCGTYKNIAPFFLAKAAKLTKAGGYISMMQPAGSLIFHKVATAQKFRSKLFSKIKLEEVTDLSTFQFSLFKNAISPACIITFKNVANNNDPVLFLCPKILYKNNINYSLIIDPQNIHWIKYSDILYDNLPFITFTWGNSRDYFLIKRLRQEQNLSQLRKSSVVITRQGINRGDQQKDCRAIVDRVILEDSQFPDNTFVYLDTNNLPINKNPKIDSRASTDFTAFNYPQMLLKQSWIKAIGRFQAAILQNPIGDNLGILCSLCYVSVHSLMENIKVLESAWLSYNSKMAVYYMLLTSGRFASYIPELNVEDVLSIPIPEPQENILEGIQTLDDVDNRIREAFRLKDSEWALIEDLFNYTLPDFKGNSSSPGRLPTKRKNQEPENQEPELTQYCNYFIRVLKASFGQDKAVCATIYQEPDTERLPVRLVAIHLNQPIHEGIKVESIDSNDLLERLENINRTLLTQQNVEQGGIYYQRVVKIYDSIDWNGLKVPTVYFIKPDKVRYWTRSMALRDADEVGADIMLG